MLTDNLVSYWKFDESSGNAEDSHGTNDLTNNGTATFSSGKINNATDLVTASSQYFSAADNTVCDVTTGDFSASFWYKGTDAATGACLFSKRITATGNGYYAILDASDRVYFSPQQDANYREDRGTTDVVDGDWHHVVITWDGTADTAKIYHNGTDETVNVTTAGTLDSLTNTNVFQIGAENTPGQYLAGSIDEFGFWSRVLTSDEILLLYNNGSGLAYPLTTSPIWTIALI